MRFSRSKRLSKLKPTAEKNVDHGSLCFVCHDSNFGDADLVWLQIIIGLSVTWVIIIVSTIALLIIFRYVLRRRARLYSKIATVLTLIALCLLLGITYRVYDELLMIESWFSELDRL